MEEISYLKEKHITLRRRFSSSIQNSFAALYKTKMEEKLNESPVLQSCTDGLSSNYLFAVITSKIYDDCPEVLDAARGTRQ